MKKKVFAFILGVLFVLPSAFSQFDDMEGFDEVRTPEEEKGIAINFDKVIHIVLPYEVEFVQPGSSYIEAVKVDEKPNIVRIVALEEEFPGATNVTIIDKGGNVYTYPVAYNKNSYQIKSIFYPDEKLKRDEHYVFLNTQNTAFVIFPSEIVYFQSGHDEIETKQVSAKNIISISTTADEFESNLFAVDKEGIEYNVILREGTQDKYVYNISSGQEVDHIKAASVKVNTENLQGAISKAMAYPRQIYNLGQKKNKINFYIPNIFVDSKFLYFVFTAENTSNIDFEIDFIACTFTDKKTGKNALQQDKDVYPIEDGVAKPKIIKGKSKETLVLVFDKFTIPDDKVFKVGINEKGGGRHLIHSFNHVDIMKATPMN